MLIDGPAIVPSLKISEFDASCKTFASSINLLSAYGLCGFVFESSVTRSEFSP